MAGSPWCLVLASACVAALVSQGHAVCTSVKWGLQEAKTNIKYTNVMAPSVVDEEVKLQQTIGCGEVGGFSSLCDIDEGGSLSFEAVNDLTLYGVIRVHRPPNNKTGYLYTTVFCNAVVSHTTTTVPPN